MPRAAIALGSNLRDRLSLLRSAAHEIDELGTVISRSPLYETDPVGGPAQGRYLNAVMLLDTELLPHELLARLQQIEIHYGRIRDEHWGPRTVDLDIVTYGSETIESPNLQIPHPRASERAFVVVPLADIAPRSLVAPEVSAEEAAAALPKTGLFRFHGDWLEGTPRLGPVSPILLAVQALLIASLIIVAITTSVPPVPTWQTVAGLAAAMIGAVLAAMGGLALGGTLSALPDPRPDGDLIERGPYRWVRHPIYGGVLIGGLGVTLMFNTRLALVPLFGLVLLFIGKSSLEERAIALLHPDYSSYRVRVPRRFIPYIW